MYYNGAGSSLESSKAIQNNALVLGVLILSDVADGCGYYVRFVNVSGHSSYISC
jgi:hypothetical protein